MGISNRGQESINFVLNMAQYLNIDEFFIEGERLEAESHIKFYEWMQQYQDISAAKRILEVEKDLELFQKFVQENEK